MLDLVPVEVWTMICRALPSAGARAAFCLANKFCNAVCTPVLYSTICITGERELMLLCNTLSEREDLCPNIRALDLDASDSWSEDSSAPWAIDEALMERFRPVLACCINLENLEISGHAHEHEAPWQFCILFELMTPSLKFPSLRHLSLLFYFNDNVYTFLQRHYHQLSSLTIEHQSDLRDASQDMAWTANFRENHSMPMPPSCTRIRCSPTLAPVFVPGSYLTRVWMSWNAISNLEEFNRLAPDLVTAMTKTRSPIIDLSYVGRSWNLRFMSLVAQELPALESLYIGNDTESWPAAPNAPDADAFITPFLREMPNILRHFKSLKVLLVHSVDFEQDEDEPFRTFDADFRTMQQWAILCPSLLYCTLPLTHTSWIRHSSYSFFVPDIFTQNPFPSAYTTQWMHDVFAREGDEFATSFIRQFIDIRNAGIPDIVDKWMRW